MRAKFSKVLTFVLLLVVILSMCVFGSVTVFAAESIASATVLGITYEVEATGSPITFPIVVRMGEETLVEDVDYTLTYANNVDPGQATVTITGIGKYDGDQLLVFTITEPAEVADTTAETTESGSDVDVVGASEDVNTEEDEEIADDEGWDEEEVEEEPAEESAEEATNNKDEVVIDDSQKAASEPVTVAKPKEEASSKTTTESEQPKQATKTTTTQKTTTTAKKVVGKSPKTGDFDNPLYLSMGLFACLIAVCGGMYIFSRVK